MKYSIFNSVISLSKSTNILYNSFSDNFLFTKKINESILKTPQLIQIKYPELYQKMITGGFYVEKEVDESKKLYFYNRNIIDDDTQFLLIINPTISCNFKCWYCYENHKSNTKMSKDILERIYACIQNIINTNSIKRFSIAFFGGEPLLYFNDVVLPIILFHSDLCIKNNIKYTIGFTSNGSLLTDEIIEKLSLHNDVGFQITLDGNKHEHNQIRYAFKGQNTYDIIMNNILKLITQGIRVRVRINYTSKNIYSLKDIADDLSNISIEHKKYIEVSFHQVWQEKDLSKDLEGIWQVVDYFHNKNLKVIFNDLNLVREPCYADVRNSAVINYNGDIYKCTAKDFTKSNREGFIDEKGILNWIKPQNIRYDCKLKYKICQTCRIAPLCGGGCSRYLIDKFKLKSSNSECIFNTDKRKDDFVLYRLDMLIRNK